VSAAPAFGGLDTTPPVLESIKVSGMIDAQAPGQSVTAAIVLTDDLSGVVKYVIDFRSPSGLQHVVRTSTSPVPSRSLARVLTIGSLPATDPPLTPFAEPGTWTADLFYAYDANGNFAGYSENELKAIGPTTFRVKNAGGYDIVAPALVSGKITTPHIRLSKPPRGTPPGTMPFAGAEVSMTDSGNGAISGGYASHVTYCTANCRNSFVMSGIVSHTGQASSTMTIGTQLGDSQPPGSYQIFALALEDGAGNESTYFSTAFGGDIDFSVFFPQGFTVLVDP